MSDVLLQRLKTHLVDNGGLLSAYDVRFYRWTDQDLNGEGSVALFRMTGTGTNDREAQYQDVSLFLLASPNAVRQADADMLAVVRYIRANYEATGLFNMAPLSPYSGPTFLQNGRAEFELVIRTATEDH